MVTIIGNVKPEDDYTHPLGPEENFNESVYFNFFDREKKMGGFLRIGNRANEGHAEMTVIVYQPDGSALFNYKRPQISTNDGWDAGGIKVDVLEPGEKIRTTYDGSVVYLADPREMREPRWRSRRTRTRRSSSTLSMRAWGRSMVTSPTPQVARRTISPVPTTSSTCASRARCKWKMVQPSKYPGHGLRDHSWGPRYWQSTPSYRWITGNFGDDMGMVISVVGDHQGGVFHKGNEIFQIKSVDLDTKYEGNTNYHESLTAHVKLSNGDEHTIEGVVKGFIPLRNRRAGMFTHIGEGMTEYTLDGGARVGYGLSEYLDQAE